MTSPASDLTDILGIRRNWWMLATILPMHLLLGISSTVLDIPHDVMVAELDSDKYRFQWVAGATLIGTIMGMAMIRWMRDRIGLKKVFLTGLALFTLFSIPCGLAQDGTVLAVGRFVQGFGKGMAVATILALFYRELPDHKDLAMALYGVGIYFGKAIAPALAGYLSDNPSWRWSFFINVPTGFICFIGSCWVLLPDRPEDTKPQRFDFVGMILMVLSMTALMICLYRGQKWGWLSSNAFLLTAAAFIVFTVSFLAWEVTTPAPLIDMSLFREPTFARAELIKSLYAVNFYTVISLLSSYMVSLRGYPRPTTGVVLLPGAIAMGLGLVISGIYAASVDRKNRLLIGLVLMAIGSWWLSIIDLYTDKRLTALVFVVWSAGAGLVVSPVICMPLEGLTQAQVVSSASIKNIVRALPGAVGGALIAILITRHSDTYFDNMRQSIEPNRPVLELVNAGLERHIYQHGAIGDALRKQANVVIEKYVHANASVYAYQAAMQYLALCVVAAILLTLFLKPVKVKLTAQGPS